MWIFYMLIFINIMFIKRKCLYIFSALSIQSIDASEKMPVVEGSEFSLACITQGSSAMQVRWYKNGVAINVDTSYRSIWTTLVPKNSKDQYTAVLGFEKASTFDTGMYDIYKFKDQT